MAAGAGRAKRINVAEAFGAIAGAVRLVPKSTSPNLLEKAIRRSEVPDEDRRHTVHAGIKVSLAEQAIAASYGALIAEVRHAQHDGEPAGGAGVGREWLLRRADEAVPSTRSTLRAGVETVEEALQRLGKRWARRGIEGLVIKEAQLEDR